MILECPSCFAKFTVPDSALGIAGREVRCGKCKHMWHAMPPVPIEIAAEALRDVVEGKVEEELPKAPDFDALMANLSPKAHEQKIEEQKKPESVYGGFSAPAFMRKKGFRIAFYSVAYAIMLAILAYVLGLKFMPEHFGHASSQGFAFEALKVERMVQLGGERFTNTPLYTIEGVIRNTSEQPKARPIIKVVLRNDTGGEVYTRTYPSPDTLIPAGGAVSFKIEKLERPLPTHTYFTIEMGNRLELALRDVSHVTD